MLNAFFADKDEEEEDCSVRENISFPQVKKEVI